MATATSHETIQDVGEILEGLGGISPARVRIKKPLGPATEADLIDLNARGGTIASRSPA